VPEFLAEPKLAAESPNARTRRICAVKETLYLPSCHAGKSPEIWPTTQKAAVCLFAFFQALHLYQTLAITLSLTQTYIVKDHQHHSKP
jgi:hypothetical protein